MPAMLASLWAITPKWLRWIIGSIAIISMTPLYLVTKGKAMINTEISVAMTSHQKDQALIDQKQDMEYKSMKSDIRFIKHYIVYKKAPPEDSEDDE